MAVKSVLGGKSVEEKKEEYPWKKKKGMGTPLAEYSEAGPFTCASCWYLISTEPREDPHGQCSEPHMLADPDTKKVKRGGKTLAVVNKQFGCCRFIDPVKLEPPKPEFLFAGDREEEAEEHEEMNEGETVEESPEAEKKEEEEENED